MVKVTGLDLERNGNDVQPVKARLAVAAFDLAYGLSGGLDGPGKLVQAESGREARCPQSGAYAARWGGGKGWSPWLACGPVWAGLGWTSLGRGRAARGPSGALVGRHGYVSMYNREQASLRAQGMGAG